MKRFFLLLTMLSGLIQAVDAQMPSNLTRNVLFKNIPVYEEVEYGLFQVELPKAVSFSDQAGSFIIPYMCVSSNKYSGTGNIYESGHSVISQRTMKVRAYRMGASMDKSILVLKCMERDAYDIGYGMETVRAYGVFHPNCDSVISLSDDGYIFSQKGKYFYSAYGKSMLEGSAQAVPITWLEKKVYEGQDKLLNPKKASSFERLSKGDVYHESADGHYYYLYRDEYMPNTVLVIDDAFVELFDQYSDEDFRLKFSLNGSHWMAVGRECFWIDGEIKSVKGYSITDFLITNEGHYGYRAAKIGAKSEGEAIVVDGQIIRRNAQVCYFALDTFGKLKFRFLSGDRCLQYENEKVDDVTEMLQSVWYPDGEQNGRVVNVQSENGRHKLSYQKGVPGVEIDGKRMTESVPCQAFMDEKNNCFVWNAIEKNGEKTELVIYKYFLRK